MKVWLLFSEETLKKMKKKKKKRNKTNIDMVVEKIITGQRNFSAEELQIYINYSEQIEAKLMEAYKNERQ